MRSSLFTAPEVSVAFSSSSVDATELSGIVFCAERWLQIIKALWPKGYYDGIIKSLIFKDMKTNIKKEKEEEEAKQTTKQNKLKEFKNQ